MASDNELIVEIDLQLKGIDQRLDSIERDAKKAGRRTGNNFSSGFSSALSSFAGNLAALGVSKAIDGIRDSLNGSVAAAAKLETIETRFRTLLGSAAAAQKQIKSLSDFAANTPFQIDGLANATSQLIAFGFEQESLEDRLRSIGDTAAGSGSDIQELATIYGQVGAAGKLTGERLLQLQERAIPIGKALADSLGVAESSVRDLVSAGQIGFDEFEAAFNSLSASGGVFENGADNLSKTLSGLISTFNDNVFNLQATAAQSFAPVLKVIIKDFTTQIQALTKFIGENSVQILEGFFSVAQGINDFVIAPIELIYNILRTVGDAINTFAAGVVSNIADIAGGVGGILNKLGVISDEALNNLNTFSESAKEVFDENFASLNDSAGKIFEGTVYGNGEEFINNLREKVALANEVTANLGNVETNIPTVTNQVEELSKAIERLEKNSKKAFKDGIGKALSSGFAALGKALAEGTNGIEAFGKALLASFGQTIAQVGQGFILEGTARAIASYGADPSAYALIGAGGAMVTFGSFISSKAGGSTASTSTGGASTVSTTASPQITDAALTTDEETPVAGNQVNITVEGNIFDRRETGLELVSVINEAIDSDNVVINQSFA